MANADEASARRRGLRRRREGMSPEENGVTSTGKRATSLVLAQPVFDERLLLYIAAFAVDGQRLPGKL